MARAGVEPRTIRLKAIDSTNAPPCPTPIDLHWHQWYRMQLSRRTNNLYRQPVRELSNTFEAIDDGHKFNFVPCPNDPIAYLYVCCMTLSTSWRKCVFLASYPTIPFLTNKSLKRVI